MLKHDWIALCRGKLHCTLCRTKEGAGRKFREHVSQHLIEQVGADFICPSGYGWDVKIEPEYTPPQPVFISGNQPPIQMNEQSELSKQRFEICKSCEHATDGGHKCALHKGCCFGSWRSRSENKCYANPPKWEAATNTGELVSEQREY
jgi:hypothetical protein